MLSYSNVSVDGAVLRVAKMSDCEDGQITVSYTHLDVYKRQILW